jgi:hypothetical protein
LVEDPIETKFVRGDLLSIATARQTNQLRQHHHPSWPPQYAEVDPRCARGRRCVCAELALRTTMKRRLGKLEQLAEMAMERRPHRRRRQDE